MDGLPRLLDALDAADVPTTCFCTGQVAERFPHRVNDLLSRGHELGSHGHSHRPFDQLSDVDARQEIIASTQALRSFGAPVTSFRAPNLRFPDRYLPLLEEQAFVVDSSQAKYKTAYYTARGSTTLRRVPASMTSSVLRLPSWIRDPWLASLASPVVLFVHPWEFVDLTHERLRLDCRFRTGAPALRAVTEVISLFRRRGAAFVRMKDVGADSRIRAAA